MKAGRRSHSKKRAPAVRGPSRDCAARAGSAIRLKRLHVQSEIDARQEAVAVEIGGDVAGFEGLDEEVEIEPGDEAITVEIAAINTCRAGSYTFKLFSVRPPWRDACH